MPAKGQKYTGLIKNRPHPLCNVIFHVLPLIGTWVIVCILQKEMGCEMVYTVSNS
jgi:hypothetical protein